MMASALGALGYETRYECEGKSALHAIREFAPHLIFCAWTLRGYDGIDILLRLRAHRQTAAIQFVFLALSADNAMQRQGMDAGADDWLVLPVDLPGLLDCARARLKRRAQILGQPTEEFELPLRATDHNLFLSYSRADTALMKHLRDYFTRQGLTVWTDERMSAGTDEWQRIIQRAIERADCVVVILSPDAKQSTWVGRELTYAGVVGVPVFPVLARGEKFTAIPIELINAQFADIRDDAGQALLALVRAIRRVVGYLGED